MYYKIVNKESEVYKQLHQLRIDEIDMAGKNLKLIEEKIGLRFKNYFGNNSQQSFRRVPHYSGFEFLENQNINEKIWKKHKEYPSIYIPNRKTKIGKEMSEFLSSGLKYSSYLKVFEILDLSIDSGSFSLPYVEIVNDVIIMYLDDKHEPKDENVIEITKKEFDTIYNQPTTIISVTYGKI